MRNRTLPVSAPPVRGAQGWRNGGDGFPRPGDARGANKLPGAVHRWPDPQAADMRAHRVQRRLPNRSLANGIAAVPAQFTHHCAWCANAVILGQEIHQAGGWRMGRRPPCRRKYLDRPAMPGLFQRHHGIDHGQARADDQHRRLRDRAAAWPPHPTDQRRRVQATGLGLRRARSRETFLVASTDMHPGTLAIAKLAAPIGIGLQIHHLGPHMLDR